MREEFEQNGELYISTEDGSVGTKGNVMDAIRENGLEADMIYACGPTPMLRAIQTVRRRERDRVLYLTGRADGMRNRCLSGMCVSVERKRMHHSNVKNKRICKDGPVFLSTEVEI